MIGTYGNVAKDLRMDPGSKRLANLMHRMATDIDFPLSEIPARYRGPSVPDQPVGVSVVEVPQPEVRVVDATDVIPVPTEAVATADKEEQQEEIVSVLLD